jgi:HEPN domain-containing protein
MPDPKRLEEALEWLRYAAEDLEVAGLLTDAPTPKAKQALFRAQQAVEKSLKAFLVLHDRKYPLTHSLSVLADLRAEIDAGLGSVTVPALWLTQYAVRFRYPGEAIQPELEQARKGIQAARAAHQGILDRLPPVPS